MNALKRLDKIISNKKIKLAIKDVLKTNIPSFLNSSNPIDTLKGYIKLLEICSNLKLTRKEELKVIKVCRRLTKKY